MKNISLRAIFRDRVFATLFFIVLCIQFVAIEGYGVSPVKVGVMALASFLFILKTPYVSKALLWGLVYWLIVYFVASYHGEMRFSTIGYLGMFIITYIVYYTLIGRGAFTFSYFTKLLKWLIIVYGIILILQQISILVGVRNIPFINLHNQYFLAINKLPSLSIEPSHSARILAVAMLGYLRCVELREGKTVSFSRLFSKEHRWVTILFLWAMLTMGSGTAFIALGLLSLYFIRWRTAIYVIPLLCGAFFVGQSLEIKQMERAVNITQAFTTGENERVLVADHSAAARVIPLMNFFRLDFMEKDTWLGHGTDYSQRISENYNTQIKATVIGNINEYGLLSFIVVVIFAYSCMIRRFFSMETLLFLFLFGMTLSNLYYQWGCMMIFTAVRYFQVQNEKGQLIIEDIDEES